MAEAQVGDTIAATAERIGRSFATELGRVLRDADRALRPILRSALDGDRTAQVVAARGVAMRRQLRSALASAGYDALVDASTTAAVETMAGAVLNTRLARAGVAFTRPNPQRLAALAELGRFQLLSVGDDVAAALWRSLAQVLFTVRPTVDILDDLTTVFEDEVANIQTLFDTQVSMFGRQVEAIATQGAGANQAYLYVGPIDALTRPFCLERVGKVYTRATIEGMDNGQIANPFISGGGYNCRHSFLAVESPELVALADTGQVAPDFAERLANRPTRRRAA